MIIEFNNKRRNIIKKQIHSNLLTDYFDNSVLEDFLNIYVIIPILAGNYHYEDIKNLVFNCIREKLNL